MPTYYLVKNDALVSMTATLKDASGPIDLSGATVTFHCGIEGEPDSAVVEGSCDIVDAANGIVRYTWTAQDTDIDAQEWAGEFQITWPTGKVQSVPTKSGGLKVVVRGEIA